ncbi:MAG: hypothetical protein U0176_08495 [Bacteroidia bacterium]
MKISEFKKLIRVFIGDGDEFEVDRGTLILNQRGELVDRKFQLIQGEVYVEENENLIPASKWIIDNLANVKVLAGKILSNQIEVDHFVAPEGKVLDFSENSGGDEDCYESNIVSALSSMLDRPNQGTTNVIYLTSDAGEGKSTIIGELARNRARAYIDGTSEWILLPIPLGGRPFMRFDEIVTASIVNRYRFRGYYFDSFIELVRLGVIIPAFDGFEEMFAEGAHSEAFSSLSSILKQMESGGKILLATRKAYFDFKSFKNQARIFDTVRDLDVSFARVTISRWNREKFVEYASVRGIRGAGEFYDLLSEGFAEGNPILTRAILAKKLVDVFQNDGRIQFETLAVSSDKYLPQFVSAIISREATDKWLDRSGNDIMQPLLPIAEHYELLGLLAEEMWVSQIDMIGSELAFTLADLFCEQKKISPSIARQVRERLLFHALIAKDEGSGNAIQFDHEEFKEFFLAYIVARRILEGEKTQLLSDLRIGAFSKQVVDTIVYFLKDSGKKIDILIRSLIDVVKFEPQATFSKENVGKIVAMNLTIISRTGKFEIEGLVFPDNTFKRSTVTQIEFRNCFFFGVTLEEATLSNCSFYSCSFEEIRFLDNSNVRNVLFSESDVRLVTLSNGSAIYDPNAISPFLTSQGIIIGGETTQVNEVSILNDDKKLQLTKKLISKFLRNSVLTENIFHQKLSNEFTLFMSEILPDLLRSGVLIEEDYRGRGTQRVFKLGRTLVSVHEAFSLSQGRFENFVKLMGN